MRHEVRWGRQGRGSRSHARLAGALLAACLVWPWSARAAPPEMPADADPTELALSQANDEDSNPPGPACDIFEVMANQGFAAASSQDLADYLPLPPRSEGQVGRFSRAGETVSVVRVTYPAQVFAEPHEAWIRERMALLSGERVVRQGATVVHIVAERSETADEVARAFASVLAGDASAGGEEAP